MEVPPPEDSMVNREFMNDDGNTGVAEGQAIATGDVFIVVLHVEVDEGLVPSGLIIRETVPDGFEVDETGEFTQDGNDMKLLLFGDSVEDQDVSYSVKATASVTDPAAWVGTWQTETDSGDTGGQKTLPPTAAECATGADTDCDGAISDTELLTYIAAWSAEGPGAPTDTDLLTAIATWSA